MDIWMETQYTLFAFEYGLVNERVVYGSDFTFL